MPRTIPSELHPGKEFTRLPGSIWVPVWTAYNLNPGVSSAFKPATRMAVIHYPIPTSGADLIHTTSDPHDGPFYVSVPRVRGFVNVQSGTGTVTVSVMASVGPSSALVVVKDTGGLTVAGTPSAIIDEALYTGYMTIKLAVTGAAATFDACFGLVYGP